jgi:hypothetical protein
MLMSTAPTITHYDVLRVSRTATAEEIKKAYRKAQREVHPDANNGVANNSLSAAIDEAKTVLLDENKRAAYDAGLDRGFSTPTSNANSAFEEDEDDSYNPGWGTQSSYGSEEGSEAYWNDRYSDYRTPPPSSVHYTEPNQTKTAPTIVKDVPSGSFSLIASALRVPALALAVLTYLVPLGVVMIVQGFDLKLFAIAVGWMAAGALAQVFLLAGRARAYVGFGKRYVFYCVLMSIMLAVWTMVSPLMGVIIGLQIASTLIAVEGIRVMTIRRNASK